MNRVRIAVSRSFLPLLGAVMVSSLLATSAVASSSTTPTVRANPVALAKNNCGVVAKVGVSIDASATPCVVTVKVGTSVRLVLDQGMHWTTPRVSSAAVQLRTVFTSTNGATGAVVVARQNGTATVSSIGTIVCHVDTACPTLARLWSVRVNVRGAAAPSITVTAASSDSGRSYTLHVGDHLKLALAGSTIYSWSNAANSNPSAIRLDSVLVSSGNLNAVFTAVGAGVSRVTAVENPNCYPQCLPPSRLFQVSVTVVR